MKDMAQTKLLEHKSGAEFDKDYMEHMVKDHEKDVKESENIAAKAQGPAVEGRRAEGERPRSSEHLELAQRIERSAGAAPRPRSNVAPEKRNRPPRSLAGGDPGTRDAWATRRDSLPARPASRSSDASCSPRRTRSRAAAKSVGGRRVKTIDVHAHCAVPEALALMGPEARDRRAPGMSDVGRAPRRDGRAGHRRRGAQHQPVLVRAPSATSRADLIELQNEKLAEFCAAHPERFVAFASRRAAVPRSRRAAARAGREEARPARRRHRRQRRRAGALRSEVRSVLGEGRGARRARLHPPAGHAASSTRAASRATAALDNTIGNPLETTIALSHLIFEGTLDRFPG